MKWAKGLMGTSLNRNRYMQAILRCLLVWGIALGLLDGRSVGLANDHCSGSDDLNSCDSPSPSLLHLAQTIHTPCK